MKLQIVHVLLLFWIINILEFLSLNCLDLVLTLQLKAIPYIKLYSLSIT